MGVAGGEGGGLLGGGLKDRFSGYKDFTRNDYDSFMGMNDADWAKATAFDHSPFLTGMGKAQGVFSQLLQKLDPERAGQLQGIFGQIRSATPLGKAMDAYSRAEKDRAARATAAPAATPAGPITPAAPEPMASSAWGAPGAQAPTSAIGGGSQVSGGAGAAAANPATSAIGMGSAAVPQAASSTGFGSGFIDDQSSKKNSLSGVFDNAVGGSPQSGGYTIF